MMRNLTRPFRAILRNAPWQILPGRADVAHMPIPALVGPLRLDIFVLRDFLRFYLERECLAAEDFARFLEEARRHRLWDLIYGWFSLYQPDAVRDETGFRGRYTNQVRRLISVWHQLAAGFDRRSPIEVKITGRTLPTPTGKIVPGRYSLGDGSHRAACLMVQGHAMLPGGTYRCRFYRARRPYDGTWALTHRRALPAGEYFGYLSEVYGAPEPLRTRGPFLDFVREVAPSRMEEVESVLRADGFDQD